MDSFSEHGAMSAVQRSMQIAGLLLVLRRGPAAQGAKQTVANLKILKRNPAEFYAECFGDTHGP
jgi:hypothetical protein